MVNADGSACSCPFAAQVWLALGNADTQLWLTSNIGWLNAVPVKQLQRDRRYP